MRRHRGRGRRPDDQPNVFSGPVHAYARYGTGLFIYNGFDLDDLGQEVRGDGLRRLWLNELQQAFNLDNLPCALVASRRLASPVTPLTATNDLSTAQTTTR